MKKIINLLSGSKLFFLFSTILFLSSCGGQDQDIEGNLSSIKESRIEEQFYPDGKIQYVRVINRHNVVIDKAQYFGHTDKRYLYQKQLKRHTTYFPFTKPVSVEATAEVSRILNSAPKHGYILADTSFNKKGKVQGVWKYHFNNFADSTVQKCESAFEFLELAGYKLSDLGIGTRHFDSVLALKLNIAVTNNHQMRYQAEFSDDGIIRQEIWGNDYGGISGLKDYDKHGTLREHWNRTDDCQISGASERALLQKGKCFERRYAPNGTLVYAIEFSHLKNGMDYWNVKEYTESGKLIKDYMVDYYE